MCLCFHHSNITPGLLILMSFTVSNIWKDHLFQTSNHYLSTVVGYHLSILSHTLMIFIFSSSLNQHFNLSSESSLLSSLISF